MFVPARESETHFPLLARRPWQLDVALRDLPSNTASAALPARTKPEPLTSCALSSLVFPLAQPGGSFRSLASSRCFSPTSARPTRLQSACTLRCTPLAICSGLLA
jgi:hypothetical protein